MDVFLDRLRLRLNSELPILFLIACTAVSVGMQFSVRESRPLPEFKHAQAPAPKELLLEVGFFRHWRESFLECSAKVDPNGLLRGIFLGEDSFISEKTTARFRCAGLQHLLSASGYNCAIVAGCISLAARLLLWLIWFRIPTGALQFIRAKIGAGAALLGAWCFFLWSDQSSPILRSVVMVSCLAILRLLRIRPRFFRLLFTNWCGFLIVSPKLFWNASFELTFGCLFGLVGAQAVAARLKFPRNFVVTYLTAGLGAVLGAIPATWLFFGEINFNSIVTNIFAVPLTSFLIMPLGLAAILVAPFWASGAVAFSLAAAKVCAFLNWGVAAFLKTGFSLRYFD